jgi:hypothetical protein
MHTLWELVLTAEPLVVMAPTPTLCSATVQHLVISTKISTIRHFKVKSFEIISKC